MYKIGEKIVYPMHGAGTIVNIEEKEILGDSKQYYIVKVPTSEIKLMVPVESADSIGVRNITDKSKLAEVFDEIDNSPEDIDTNWNKRYRDHLQKMKTGELVKVGVVAKNLLKREKERMLSTCEKKMLTNALHIIVSEISLSESSSPEDVEYKIKARFLV